MAARRRSRKRSVVAEASAVYLPRRILLDTHVWLWWATGDRRLGPAALALIKRTDEVRFSAASAWEIAIKAATGKLPFRGDIDMARELDRDGFTPLSITIAHADEVRRLPVIHRDPFDRLLIAQARIEGLTIVTADDLIPRYGCPSSTRAPDIRSEPSFGSSFQLSGQRVRRSRVGLVDHSRTCLRRDLPQCRSVEPPTTDTGAVSDGRRAEFNPIGSRGGAETRREGDR